MKKIGWAVGECGSILKTIDGGDNWEKQESGTANHLVNIFFIDSSIGWVVGGGIILKTTNGGLTWVEDNPKQNKNFVSLINIYPNPFSSYITLDIIGINKHESIIIYDLFGRTVLTKQTEFLESGKTQHITLNTENLPQGVYFVRVQGSPGVKTIIKINN